MKSWGLAVCPFALLLVSSCSSFIDHLRSSIEGSPDPLASSDRGPKSIGLEDESSKAIISQSEEDLGAKMAAQEFARLRGHDDDSARRGFRRPASPWDGVQDAKEGSLWDENLQSNFLFAQNMIRKVGDLLAVKFESEVTESLNEKIHVIIMKQWPDRLGRKIARDAIENDVKSIADLGKSAEKTVKEEAKDAAKKALAEEADPIPKYLSVADMTVRVTETMSRGSLRIAGTKRVLIKGAPYSLHLTGIIQGEDVQPDLTVSSRRVLESKLELTR